MGTIVITGATGGIGAPTVRRLAEQGHRVLAGARDVDRASSLFDGLPGVEPLALDVTDEESVRSAATEVGRRLGSEPLGAVVNNAGLIVEGPLELVERTDLAHQLDVNVLGPATVVRAFLPLLRAGRGRIVNVGAPTAHLALPLGAPISASKAALTSLNDALRVELAPFGIRVVLVEPGGTDTEIFARAGEVSSRSRARADAQVVRLYAPMVEAVARTSERMSLDDPAAVAEVMVRAITAARPRSRYRIGAVAKAAPVIAKLPTGLADSLVTRAAGLSGVAPAEV